MYHALVKDQNGLTLNLTGQEDKWAVTSITGLSSPPVTLNTSSYAGFDEDGLNREVRNFLDSAITRFGYTIADQTQQGLSGTKPGELDIRISKNGIPIAIYEELIHKDRNWLGKH